MSLSMFASLSPSSQLICSQVKRKIVRVGIRGFIDDLKSVVSLGSLRYSGYLLCTRGFDRLLGVRKPRQAPSTYLETREQTHLTPAVMWVHSLHPPKMRIMMWGSRIADQFWIQLINHPPSSNWTGRLQGKGKFLLPRGPTAKPGWGYGIKNTGREVVGKKSARRRPTLRR